MKGQSILETFWTKLDELVKQAYDRGVSGYPDVLTGEIKGVIWCIATMTNPYQPNVQMIRKEAVRRYQQSRTSRR